MAVPEKDEPRVGSTEKNSKKLQTINYEIQCARHLAGNNKSARDRALKSLQKWFTRTCSYNLDLQENDLLRLWKGLFYTMWMSDKPLIQEECAENISNLIHYLKPEHGLQYFKCGLQTLINEWNGIDQLRLDKFAMLVRRLLRQAINLLKQNQFNKILVKSFTEQLSNSILNVDDKSRPIGLVMHFIEIYLEEVAKIGQDCITPNILLILLLPFIKQLALTDDLRIIQSIRQHIFIYLIRQSDLGIEYREKYEAWKRLGFPGSIEAMKRIEVDDDNDDDEEDKDNDEETKTELENNNSEEVVYDPRAGKVDVELPQLKFHPKAISKALLKYRFESGTTTKSRKIIIEIADHFKKISAGIYPLGTKRLKLPKDNYDTNVKKAVNRLVKFEKQLSCQKRKRKKNSPIMTTKENKKIKLDQDEAVNGTKKIDIIPKNNKIKPAINNNNNNNNSNNNKKKAVVTEIKKAQKRPLQPIKKPTTAITTNVKKRRISSLIDDNSVVEAMFKRNSGIWVVTTPVKCEETKKVEENKSTPTVGMNEKKNESIQQNQTPKSALKDKNNSVMLSTPTKRVKINTKLNTSQEVYEHYSQILSSPAIPFDADKKPSKPLLKSPIIPSPINPFYKKRLSPRLAALS